MKKISLFAIFFASLVMFSPKIQAQPNFTFDGANITITLNNDYTQIIAAEFSVNNEIFPFDLVNNENQVSGEGDGIVYTGADPAGNIFVMEYSRALGTVKVMDFQTNQEIILNVIPDGPFVPDGPLIVPPSRQEEVGQNVILIHTRGGISIK
jgi:hypothetical protein